MAHVAVGSMAFDPTTTAELKRRWRWFVALGAALVALGILALGAVVVATLASVVFFGFLLAIAGAVQITHASGLQPSGGFTRHLVGGVLALAVGMLMIANPAAGALSLTLLMAVFFTIVGIVRIIHATAYVFPGRGLAFVGGIVSFILGILIYAQWPVSGIWVIGTFVGIDLIFDGCAALTTGLALRRLPS